MRKRAKRLCAALFFTGLLSQQMVLADSVANLLSAGKVAYNKRDYPAAEKNLQLAIAQAKGVDSADLANSCYFLAFTYLEQEKYNQAEPIFKQALSIRERLFGASDMRVAEVLVGLGSLYRDEERFAEAEPLFKRAVAIREKAAPKSPELARAVWNLGRLYYKEGRYSEVEPFYQRALAIDKAALGPSDEAVGGDLSSLGRLYYRQGRFAQAEPLYKQALAIDEKKLGVDDPTYAADLNYLADLYADEQRFAEALPIYQRALAIAQKTDGQTSTTAATYLGNIAGIYLHQKRYAEAEKLFKQDLAILEKTVGPNHHYVTSPLDGLAEVYRIQGKFAEAEPLYRRAIAVNQASVGANHPALAFDLHNLALLLMSQGRAAEAEKLFRQSIGITSKEDSPGLANQLNSLAQFYVTQKRFVDAEPLLKRSLAIDLKYFGQQHASNRLDKAACMLRFPIVAHCALRLVGKIPGLPPVPVGGSPAAFQRAADFYAAKLPTLQKESLDYADCLELKCVLASAGTSNELVMPGLLEALRIKSKLLGENDPRTQETKLSLGLYLQSLGVPGYAISWPACNWLSDFVRLFTSGDPASKPLAIKTYGDESQAAQCLSDDLLCVAYLEANGGADSSAKENAQLNALLTKQIEKSAAKVKRLSEIATLDELLGQYSCARSVLEEAKQLAVTANDLPATYDCQLALASLCLGQSDFVSARENASSAIVLGNRIFTTDKSSLADAFLVLSEADAKTGHLEESLKAGLAALVVLPGGFDARRADALVNLAELFIPAGKLDTADSFLTDALKTSQNLKGDQGKRALAKTYLAMGELEAARANPQAASTNFAKAIDILSLKTSNDLIIPYVRALNGQALALKALGDTSTSHDETFLAADTLDQYIETVFPQLSFGEQCAFLTVVADERDALLSLASNDESLLQSYDHLIRWKGLLIESLRRQSALEVSAAQNPKLKAMVDQWHRLRRALAALSLGNAASADVHLQLSKQLEATEQELAREGNVEIADPLRAMGAAAFAHKLKPNEAFVDVFAYKPAGKNKQNLVAIVLTDAARPVLVDLGDEDSFIQLVAQWRHSVTGESIPIGGDSPAAIATRNIEILGDEDKVQDSNVDTYANLTAELQEKFWQKINKVLPAEKTNVWLCLEGSVARVPWNAISREGSSVTVVDSPREVVDLVARRKGLPNTCKILIAGNINFNDPKRRVANLPATEKELDHISELARSSKFQVTALSGEQATKGAVTRDLKGVQYVHLATHGFSRAEAASEGKRSGMSSYGGAVAARNPLLETGLFLAYPEGKAKVVQEEPGVLTAEEMVGLDLKSCDLFALSACQTGLGQGLAGQGIIGLRSAVIGAGARSILMSLWPVSDDATEVLMGEFYKNLWTGGKTKAESLRLAQNVVRSNRRWSNARYWAPWVLGGESW